MPLTDIQCKACGVDQFDVFVPLVDGEPDYPLCECGARTEWLAVSCPKTDVLGHEVHDPINDLTYTSRREAEREMKRRGWDPCGDKVGGARNEEYLNLGKQYSFLGQDSR